MLPVLMEAAACNEEQTAGEHNDMDTFSFSVANVLQPAHKHHANRPESSNALQSRYKSTVLVQRFPRRISFVQMYDRLLEAGSNCQLLECFTESC